MEEDVKSLIERAKGGDRDALAAVFERYHSRIHGLVRKKLGDRLRGNLDSSDVVQSVCLEAMRGIETLEYRDEEGFVHWLARITENTIRDKYRYFGAQKRRMPEPVSDEPTPSVSQVVGDDPTPSNTMRNVEQMQLVLQALRRLPEDYRQIIRLTRFEKMSHEEAASVMGRTEKAARMLLARARVRLLKEIEGVIDESRSD